MTKPLLIIKTGNTIAALLEAGTDFEDWFRSGCELAQTETMVCSLHLNEALPPLDSVGGIIITGSPAYVTDLADWNYIGADYIRMAHQKAVPILGVCYGHQLIAWAFGGKVDFNPNGREIGTVTIDLADAAAADALFKGLPEQFKANASHQQSVTQLPAGAVRLAFNELDGNHGFSLGDVTWGLQFHPEFTGATTRAYIKARSGDINNEGLQADCLHAAVEETPEAASLLKRFRAIMQSRAS
ncbi:MAG: GMP synthase (glutamine-hydrolyzing) [Pseudohongiellaceae bacterium]|jgi:GMP synthase (glutamine-hydrolysing)